MEKIIVRALTDEREATYRTQCLSLLEGSLGLAGFGSGTVLTKKQQISIKVHQIHEHSSWAPQLIKYVIFVIVAKAKGNWVAVFIQYMLLITRLKFKTSTLGSYSGILQDFIIQ